MKWKFENIDVIFSCSEDDFERTSNYSRNKLKTDDKIIYLDQPIIDGNDSTNIESDICESSEDIVNTDKHKSRRKTSKMSDVPAVLDDNDSIIE
jgi:hypothetical protein